jgi:hypothetical protein
MQVVIAYLRNQGDFKKLHLHAFSGWAAFIVNKKTLTSLGDHAMPQT